MLGIHIVCVFQNKKIEVPIKAVLPEAEIQVPDHLNFGYCAVKDSTSIQFQVKNLRSVYNCAFFFSKIWQTLYFHFSKPGIIKV